MVMVNMHAAKSNLSQLVARMEAGEEIVIARNGEPVARLVPYVERMPRPQEPGFGAHTGRIIGELEEGPVFGPEDYADPDLWSDD